MALNKIGEKSVPELWYILGIITAEPSYANLTIARYKPL